LIGLKSGQSYLQKAISLKEKLQSKGKKALLFVIREVAPEALMQFPSVDAFVNTTCPRLAIDDAIRFSKPMLTINEALVIIGEMSWETFCKKDWFEN
jgi:2-(3-amino-3-carboxypropyl)histidine synthase